MPQSTKELFIEWGPGPEKAVDYLRNKGFKINHHGFIVDPPDYELTEEDYRAIEFLVEEWDYA